MGLLILAGLGFWFWKTRTDAPPVDYTMTVPEDGQHAQPSQRNPIQKYIYDARQDTANQPWFGGSKQFQDAESTVNELSDSVKDLWWNLDNHNTSGMKDPYAVPGPVVSDGLKNQYNGETLIFTKGG